MLLGAFTDGDLRRSLQRRSAEALSLPLSDVMTAAPRTCCSDLKAVDAMQVLHPHMPIRLNTRKVNLQRLAANNDPDQWHTMTLSASACSAWLRLGDADASIGAASP